MSSRRSRSARHADRHDVEAVEQILAEAAAPHLRGQIAVGRGDDADIDLDAAGTADPLEGLLLQHPHDLALGLERHVGDLVEQQRAAMGLLERADLGRAVGAVARLSLPNSSISSRSARIVAQLTTTKGPPARLERRCSSRAATSLPQPGGPGDQHPAAGRRHPLDLLARHD